MKKSILAVAVIFSVAVFFVSCKEQPKEEVVVEATDANTEMAMNDVYMCDMKCQAYSEPGNCECGMELKKVEVAAVDTMAVEENHEGHNH
ncbi:MAG TPA: hypothetical protein VFY09_02950 [Flavobacteriaceae bacterium]|nr:hypothetical protein [Flavobacteriaceae bacterium]